MQTFKSFCYSKKNRFNEVFSLTLPQTPSGYEVRNDPNSSNGRYYVNIFTGVRWFSARDAQGKVYFYEENGNESCWRLPSVGQSIQDVGGSGGAAAASSGGGGGGASANTTASSAGSASANSSFSRSERIKRPLTGSTKRIADNVLSMQQEEEEAASAGTRTKTEMLLEGRGGGGGARRQQQKPSAPLISSPNFQIGGVSIVVVKQGPLRRTKLVENGRKHRKNWSSSHTVLTDTFLLFFKDHKSFASMQRSGGGGGGGGHIKPEHCVDLHGARVEWCCERVSKRSNVFEVTNAVLGTTMLLQDDSLQVSAEWFQEIREVIEALMAARPPGQDAPERKEEEEGDGGEGQEEDEVREGLKTEASPVLTTTLTPPPTTTTTTERKSSEPSQVRYYLIHSFFFFFA